MYKVTFPGGGIELSCWGRKSSEEGKVEGNGGRKKGKSMEARISSIEMEGWGKKSSLYTPELIVAPTNDD